VPELPEVETTRLGVLPHVVNRSLTHFEVRNSALRWPVELPASLVGQRLLQVERRGKYLLFQFKQGNLIVHLGMSGSLRVLTGKQGLAKPAKPHDHVDLVFGTRLLRYNDPRRFGSFHWHVGDLREHRLLQHLGPEPLGADFSGAHLKRLSKKRTQAVKNFIMDGRVVVGVGNIYANEALFLAGIRPTVAAGRVTLAGYERLAATIVQVLSAAIEMGGTTLRDFVGSNGEPGYFKQQLYVYGRDGLPCRVCDTLLKPKTIGQRASVYCPKCQRGQGFNGN